MVEKRAKTEEMLLEARNFFNSYKKEIGQSIRTGKNVISINFNDLASFSHILSELLLSSPEETFQVLELALEDSGLVQNPRIRLTDLPVETEKIRNLRAAHLNKLIQVEGIIRQASEVRPQVVNAKFECPSCGSIISILQIESKFREPTRCSCGRRGGFKLVSKDMVDAQRLVIEESPESLSGGEQPRRISIFLKEDLVEPKMEEKTTPGSRVRAIGILKEVPKLSQSGGTLTRYDIAIEANNLIPLEESFEELAISEEDERQIQELAADPNVFRKLAESIAPSIYGYEEIKEALVLQLFGGVKKIRSDGTHSRGDMHILLVGDPGVAKSVTLKFIAAIAPKGRYVAGKSATGAGITATVVRDEFLRGWSLEAGAMVLSNKGVICIDELEKMDPQDRSAMHEAMEQQCYHYDTIITLADGSERKIGELVEELLSQNKEEIIQGKDCLILPSSNLEVFTTDFNKIYKTKVSRISKHKAFDKFIKIKFSNGREITVTPEHPVFCAENGKIIAKRADSIKIEDDVPIPLTIPIEGKEQYFNYKVENKRAVQHIKIPEKNSEEIFKIIGYLISEGSREINRKKLIGINFTNKDQRLLDDFEKCMNYKFGIKPYKQARIDENGTRYMYRYISTELSEFFKQNFPEILKLSGEKQIPQILMRGRKEDIAKMLSALFEGDGYVSIKKRTIRIGYSTKSRRLAEQIQDLLLRFGIRSNINENREYFKVLITSYDNIEKFLSEISFITPEKNQIIKNYLKEKIIKRTVKDIIPKNFSENIISIIKDEKIEKVGRYKLYGIIYDHLKRKNKFSFSREFLKNLLKLVKKENNKRFLEALTNEIGWEKVAGIEIIDNESEKWVYDITIEPQHAFVSQAAILHNTVTISKANVQACYSEDTEVLTETGWKKYAEVKEEKIAQYNPKDRTIQFLPHKGLYTYDYNSKMYHFKNGKNDILVTPNHKMLAREFSQKNLRAIEAQNLDYNYIKFVNSGDYIGKEKKYFVLPAIKHKQNRRHPKYVHQHIDKKIFMDLWLEFLGYYLTEGGIETAPTIGIVQRKGENAEKIKRCLTKLTSIMGCSLSKIDCKKYIRYKITQTQLYEYLKNLGKNCYFKKSNLNFSLLSKRQLKILFEALLLGDGSSDKKYFSVTSKELSDELQIIAHLIGKSAPQHIHYLEGSRKNRKTMFRVSISNETEPSIRKRDIKIIDYTGKVFCFSTETGFFITRRNGKIAIQGNTLRAETSVLAAANPKFGRFDPYQTVSSQIDIPPTLINRFDVIFVMKDIPDRAKDEAIATHVLLEHKYLASKNVIDRDLFRKYIAYAKQRVIPQLTDEAVDEIKKFYVDLRNMSVSGDSPTRPLPISARQLEALIRLSEASAKTRLSNKVTKEDAKHSINLVKFYLMQVGYDYETKTFDIDRIATGVSTSQRGKIMLVRETLARLESRLGKLIPIEELKKELEGKVDAKSIEDSIDKLTISGDIFHPRKGFVQRM